MEILALGHSTRPWPEFVELLLAHDVRLLADIRTVPRSRANPQFEAEHLARTLPAAGIRYVHLPGLGGLRRPRPDSGNVGLSNSAFRGYADYMETPAFAAALDELLDLARETRTAVMCAEGNPWRCHRMLLADALLARGVAAAHVVSRKSLRPHRLSAAARIVGSSVSYPEASE